MDKITWTAKNSASFLNGERSAKTMRSAVRAAREYILYELGGAGTVIYYVNGAPVRRDEKSIHTGYKWVSEVIR